MSDAKSFENKKPHITVIGVGGAGGNAVNNMIRAQLEGVEFVVANTDAQALRGSLAPRALQLGGHTTQGLGAGSRPEVGRASAEEDLEEVQKAIKGSHMLFITAGMGGGTGTGAAPVIAKAARDMGILTVGVVTKPFHFEGVHRMRTAERGIEEMQHVVDTLIIIPNQNLFRVATDKTTFADAFNMADHVLYSGVRGITDLMIMPGLVNLDFADVRAIMDGMGSAMMGTGEADGDGRAIHAAESAIANPLLESEISMRGAKGVLINITGGLDMTLFEVDEAANRIREEVDDEANIIFGSTFDERLNGRIRVSVVATGINGVRGAPRKEQPKMTVVKPELRFEMAASAAEPQEEVPAEASVEADQPLLPREELMARPTQSVAASVREEESEGRRGFFERLGFKRARASEEDRPGLRGEPQGEGPAAYHAPEEAPEASVRRAEEGVGRLERPPVGEQEQLDIPAFLRKRRPGS